ncbi:MAG: MFS transporter [Pseudomonadota bacterium]
MLAALGNTWALMFGIFLLQVGNGIQGTALGIRGALEGFDATTMGYVMSGYFVGFFGGAHVTPILLRRVGHVRVFAALASLISAAFILYAAAVSPAAWLLMRLLCGFCFSGVYVVAESWLNNQSDNNTRGQTLSAYLICQMVGIIVAQALVPLTDPAGYDLFVIMSVAVSIACAPILLSASPTPFFETSRQLPLRTLFKISPLGAAGMIASGAIFASMFGMTAVYGTEKGLSITEISIVMGAFYLGAALLQFPIGWISDRMDRRRLIAMVTATGMLACLMMSVVGDGFVGIALAAVLVGGIANPLYSLLVAHTNDFMEREDMAAAAGGLVLLNGIGAAGTPVLVGYLLQAFGPEAFPLFMAVIFAALCAYAFYRMTVRPATPVEETLPYAPVAPAATQASYEAAQEYYAEQADALADEQAEQEAAAEAAAEAPVPERTPA